MIGQNFACTACGKCCKGPLPLTIKDALKHVDVFPLAVSWSPVALGHRDYSVYASLGFELPSPRHKKIACAVNFSSYLPSALNCPALGSDQLCRIQSTKPLRCQAMPFYPWRAEKYQAAFLAPRVGWDCDVSDAAPVVYLDGKITEREAFDREKALLIAEAQIMREYAQGMLRTSPSIAANLDLLAQQKGQAGFFITSFSSFLNIIKRDKVSSMAGLAAAQMGVLTRCQEQLGSDQRYAKFTTYYANSLREMSYLATKDGAQTPSSLGL